MLKNLLPILSLALLLAWQPATAQSVETFDTYTVGDTLNGLDGGQNWSAPWSTRKGNNEAAIAAGGVSVPTIGFSSGGDHLFVQHPAGAPGIRAARLLDSPVTDDGNTYYLSWFQDTDYDNPAAHGSVAQVMLTNDAALGAGGPGGQLVRMGKLFNTAQFGIDGGAGASGSIEGTDTRNGMFVVVAISMSGDENAEALSFFINPDPAATSLDTADADLTLMATLNNGFDAIGYKCEGPAGMDARLDAIRFGSTLSEVIGDEIVAAPGINTDNFNAYGAGEGLDGLDGGMGWDSTWVTVDGDEPVVTEGGLQNFSTLRETSGNRIVAQYTGTTGDSRYFRLLNTPFADDGSTYYFSYSSQSSYTDRGGQADFFMLIDSETYGPTGPGGQLLQVGKPLNTPFIGAGFGGTNNFELTTAMAEEVNFVVVKLVTNGTAEPDTVSLFINPSTEDGEPMTADAVKVTDRLNSGFDAIGFKATGLSPGNSIEWDDVLVGLEYDDVLPQDFTELEPLTDAFAVETFNTYATGDTLGGAAGGTGWAGPWVASPSSDNSTIRAGGLLNNTLAAATSGNSLRISADGMLERSIRSFSTAIDTSNNADFWFSAHLATGGGPAGTVGNLILIDSTAGNDQQVIIGKQFGSQNLFATGPGQVGGPTQTGQQFDGVGATFVVGNMTRNNGQWELDLYVNPDPTAESLDEASAQIINKLYNSGNFTGVAVRIDGDGTELTWGVDDIYFGGAYTDVLPPDLSAVPAAPPGASEPFAYTVGDSLIGQDGGNGFTGPWQLLSASGNGVIEEDGITSLELLRATPGSSVQFDDYLRAVRPLTGTYGDVGRDFWIGWWFDVDAGGGNVAHLVLADTATYAGTGPAGQLVQIGKTFGGSGIGVVASQGGTAGGVSAEDGHFMVAHVVTNGGAEADDIFLWIDPDLSAVPSADSADVAAAADLTNWNGLGFKFEGNAGEATSVAFDDIIVGFSFDEVIPDNLVEVEPPNMPQVAEEVFDYEAGQDLNGAEGGSGWGGPWEAVSGSVVIGDGNVESPRTCPEGNSASLDQMGTATPVAYRRPLFNPFGVDETSETFYLSFVLNIDAKDIGNSGLVSITSGDNPLLSIGGVPGLPALAAIRNTEIAPITSSAFQAVGTKWFVVRMDVDAETATATARVFVDPAADAIPADESAIFTIENIDVFDGIDGIGIGGAGAQSVSLMVDDIRAGFSYRDISCQFGSDDPDLLAYEPFNYDTGTTLFGAGGVNAFWDGPWVDAGGQIDNTAIVQEGSIDVDGIDEEANKVELNLVTDNEQLRADRPLAFPIESDGRTYWLSYFLNTTLPDQVNNVANITLLNTGIADRGGQRIAFGRIFGGGLLGSIVIPNNNPRRSEVMDDGLNWMVAQMATSADGPDTVTLFINPTVSENAPDTTDAGFIHQFTTDVLDAGINAVRLKVEGANANQSPYTTEMDEVKIATAWSSITGMVTSLDPLEGDPFQVSAYPNPFSTEVTINYELAETGSVTVDLLNLNGQLVQRIQEGRRAAGPQQTTLSVNDQQALPNGFYLLRLSQNGRSTTRRLVLYR